jgi:hypothetical protein
VAQTFQCFGKGPEDDGYIVALATFGVNNRGGGITRVVFVVVTATESPLVVVYILGFGILGSSVIIRIKDVNFAMPLQQLG